MKIVSLHLENFRTYRKIDLEFNSRLTFITGNNASGKTNILEALSLLSHGKSFRGSSDYEMVSDGCSHYYISSRYDRRNQKHEIEIGCDVSSGKIKRKIKMDSKVLSGRPALVGNLISVIFSPADIMIVEGGSSIRRRFLDLVISNQNPDYLKNLILYNRSLRQRNSILKRIKEKKASAQDLLPWESGISEYAEKITKSRLDFINKFQEIFQNSLKRISGSRDFVSMDLQLCEKETHPGFKESLKDVIYKDISAGFTTIGPHRHGIYFQIDGRDISAYGSQGQKRSLVLALRVAQFYYLKENLKISPLLLIDDVIKELDKERRSAFAELLHESGQAIFTTPDLEGMESFLKDTKSQIEIINVNSKGSVLKSQLEN
ncbi:MAG: DNA replication/repair protein RecF [Spirochaetia bacterium]|nr:DNA replication/repair protein RecF [Spirochaetia bacterium]